MRGVAVRRAIDTAWRGATHLTKLNENQCHSQLTEGPGGEQHTNTHTHNQCQNVT